MDNTNNLSQSILQSSEVSFPSMGTSATTSDDIGFFDSFKNINATTWVLIILILAFLGFNIFVYLAKGTQTVTDIFAPLMQKIFGTTIDVTSQAVDVSAEGAKAVVGETAGVVEGGLTAVQNLTPGGAAAVSTVKGQPVNQQKVDIMQQSALNKALNTAQTQQPGEQDYQAYEASSSVHSAGKSGWCFIGEDRGFRSCAQVGVNDTCMSGDIFPSQEICMNPNLRA
jgi:hypothetical protein